MAQRIKGEGSIFWEANKERWTASTVIGRNAKGHPVYKRFYGPRGDKSRIAKKGVIYRLDAFTARNPRNVSRSTIDTYVRKYINSPELRTTTRAWYEQLYRNYLKETTFAALRLVDVMPKHVRDYLETVKPGSRTQQAVYTLVRRTFQIAIENEDLHLNPAANVRKPHVARTEMQVWSPQEALTFLRAAQGDRLYALYLLALTTTMGPAELFGLQRSSLHLDAGYLIVQNDLVEVSGKTYLEETKNRTRTRRIDLPKAAVDALRERLKIMLAEGHAGSSYVFTNPQGAPIVRSAFRRLQWAPILEKAALIAEKTSRENGDSNYEFPRITMYGMRHTANALMGYLGVPIQIASERMGHSSIQQTVDTYGHLYEGAQRGVADKFEEFLRPLSLAKV